MKTHYRNNLEILSELHKHVYGHTQAKKHLINFIRKIRIPGFNPGRMLLIGESGTGKTYLINTIAKMLGFNLIYLDATQLTPSGNSDGIRAKNIYDTINKHANKVLHKYNSLQEAINDTVLFIDEIDKLAVSFDSSGNWNKHVQANFLSMFDASTIPDEYKNISIIFAGAFHDLRQNKTNQRSLGFYTENNQQSTEITDEDIIKAGLIPELVGRLTTIVELDKFTWQDYYNIVYTLLLKEKYAELEQLDIYNVPIDKDFVLSICKKAEKSSQGVRYLKREINNYFLDCEFDFEFNKGLSNDR